MSISTLETKINRLTGEIDRLQKDFSKLIKDESTCNSAISKAMSSIQRTKNSTTIASNQRTIDSNNKKLAGITSKKADVLKKIATINTDLSKAKVDLSKETAREQKKLQANQKKELQKIYDDQKRNLAAFSSQPAPFDLPPDEQDKKYDIFISHASDDKEDFVVKLTDELKLRNINIWYDSDSIVWGASIRESIDKGLRNSKFGLVVISPSYINKYWTQYELNGILKKESRTGKQNILPIWHKITADEVQDYSYALADKLAFNTAINTVHEIANAIDSMLK